MSDIADATTPAQRDARPAAGDAGDVKANRAEDGTARRSRSGQQVSPRKRRHDFVRWTRLGVQLVFLLLSPQAFSTAFSAARSIMVSLGKGEAIEMTGFTITLVALLVHTIVFGRFFCGYACAFGTLGDLLFQLGDAIRRKLRLRSLSIPDKVEDVLRLLKYLVLVALLAGSFLGAGSIISSASPWTAFGHLTSLSLGSMGIAGGIILLVLMVPMLLKERVFCEFLCPLGALFSLMPIIPRSNRHRNPHDLAGSAGCKRACPVRIYPPGEGWWMGECIQCDRCECVARPGCVTLGPALQRAEEALRHQGFACETRAACASGSQRPTAPRPSSYLFWHDYRTLRVAALALVLLGLLWLGGTLNYLPASPLVS